MKFIHLSDLHIGKRVNGFSMLEEQEAVLSQILSIIDEQSPDGVLIAGDVYDKSVPSAEAVQLFDDFLVRVSERHTKIFIISGNHDSPERIAFASRIMKTCGIHLSPVYNGCIAPTVMEDAYGKLNVYLLPFLKPAHVRRFFPDDGIDSYTDALRTAINAMKINPCERNVLLSHQFVTGASTCESEEISVGGSENVDASVYESFDYVALGHIHGAQSCTSERIRYCGTPLKYSFSEVNHQKSVTVIELNEKNAPLKISTVPLSPIHDMRELRGSFALLTDYSFYSKNTFNDDYLRIILTDEEDIPDAVGRLRIIYRNLMCLEYDNTRTRTSLEIDGAENAEQKSPYELFAEFYEQQNNAPLSEEQGVYMKQLIEKIEEETV